MWIPVLWETEWSASNPEEKHSDRWPLPRAESYSYVDDLRFKLEMYDAVKLGMEKLESAAIPSSSVAALKDLISDWVASIALPWLTDDAVLRSRYEALVRQGWIERTANDPTPKKEEPKKWDGTEQKEELPKEGEPADGIPPYEWQV